MALPALVPMLIGAVGSAMGFLIGRALIALGVSVVTYYGVGSLLDVIYAQVDAVWLSAGSYPAIAKGVQLLGILRIDVCLDIIIAAYAGRLTLLGMLTGGSITRLVTRFSPPG